MIVKQYITYQVMSDAIQILMCIELCANSGAFGGIISNYWQG